MPYITNDQRAHYECEIEDIVGFLRGKAETESIDGDLNYIITKIVSGALCSEDKDWSYVDITKAVAAFECAKLEFYRRVAAPKEDRAITKNGDVLEYSLHS